VQTSEQFDAIAAALAKAQGVMDAASKDAANPHFKARFASLASVREAIRKPLSENGIAYIQTLRTNEGAVEVDTRLIHSSGQFIGDTLRVPLAQATPQGVGSASSYGRRYALMAIVGLAAEDDDAEAAHGRTGNGVSARNIPRIDLSATTRKPPGPALVSDATINGDFGEPNDGEEYDDSAPRNAYIAMCKEIILNTNKSEADVREWWKGEQQSRRDFDLSQTEVNLLKSVIAERFKKVPA
jgi:hypothetical protein